MPKIKSIIIGGGALAPNGDGSALTGLTPAQVGALAPDGDGSALMGLTPAQVGALAPDGDGSALTGVSADINAALGNYLPLAGGTMDDNSTIFLGAGAKISGVSEGVTFDPALGLFGDNEDFYVNPITACLGRYGASEISLNWASRLLKALDGTDMVCWRKDTTNIAAALYYFDDAGLLSGMTHAPASSASSEHS